MLIDRLNRKAGIEPYYKRKLGLSNGSKLHHRTRFDNVVELLRRLSHNGRWGNERVIDRIPEPCVGMKFILRYLSVAVIIQENIALLLD